MEESAQPVPAAQALRGVVKLVVQVQPVEVQVSGGSS